MPQKRRSLHKLDWSIYLEEQERRLHLHGNHHHHHHTEHGLATFEDGPEYDGQNMTEGWLLKLNHHNDRVRLEAVKALKHTNELVVLEAMVKKIQDCDLAVRWAASDVLINAGRKSLRPLLEALTRDFNSYCLRESARHILQELHQRGHLNGTEVEVLHALERAVPAAVMARAANNALIAAL